MIDFKLSHGPILLMQAQFTFVYRLDGRDWLAHTHAKARFFAHFPHAGVRQRLACHVRGAILVKHFRICHHVAPNTPHSKLPPGKDQSPLPGSLARWMRSTSQLFASLASIRPGIPCWPFLNTATATPTRGCAVVDVKRRLLEEPARPARSRCALLK